MSSIKVFIILAVGTLHFAVMAWSERTNQLVGNLSLFERALKERKIAGCRSAKAFSELKTVVSLNALYGNAEPFEVVEHMDEKLRRGIGTVFFKSFKITVARKLIDSGILIESSACGCPHKASRRDKFDIYLYTLRDFFLSCVNL